MEWVEFSAKTIDEAKARALEELGIDEEEAEFEILEEPKPGLFGRIRGEARIRARVQPTPVRAKRTRGRGRGDQPRGGGRSDESRGNDHGRGRNHGGNSGSGNGRPEPSEATNGDQRAEARATEAAAQPPTNDAPSDAPSGNAPQRDAAAGEQRSPRTRDAQGSDRRVSAEEVGAEAVAFVEGLISAFDVEGETRVQIDGDDIEVHVTGSDLGLLVGPRGTTLQAIQDLARVASQRRLGDQDTRLRIDIAGYRERRRQALSEFARKMADEVVSSGTARVLEPMGSADRKIIHDALNAVDGVETRSEGDDPYRRVVIAPK